MSVFGSAAAWVFLGGDGLERVAAIAAGLGLGYLIVGGVLMIKDGCLRHRYRWGAFWRTYAGRFSKPESRSPGSR